MEEQVKWGVACTRVSDDDRGRVSRKMTGRRWDLVETTTGTSDSMEESDMVSSESLEDDEAAEENGSGELSELARGWSSESGR